MHAAVRRRARASRRRSSPDKQGRAARRRASSRRSPRHVRDKIVEGQLEEVARGGLLSSSRSATTDETVGADSPQNDRHASARTSGAPLLRGWCGLGEDADRRRSRRLSDGESTQRRAAARPALPAAILLKLSGEAADGRPRLRHRSGDARARRSPDPGARSARAGVEVAIVVSAAATSSAAWRQPRAAWTARPADYMGMLATVMNALALQDALEQRRRAPTRVLTAIAMQRARRAVHPPPRHAPPREGPRRHLRRRHRQPVLHDRHRRGAARDGDRRRGAAQGHQGRRRLRQGSDEAPRRAAATIASPTSTCSRTDLKVMDSTAVALCRDNKLPIVVFDLHTPRQHPPRRPRRVDRHAGHRRGEPSMVNDIVKDLEGADRQDARCRSGDGARLQGPHRPRLALLVGASRRLLRHADAAQPARVDQRPRVRT